jgi:ribosomal protein S18 acetylase RimI-like enzyme
MSDHVGLYEKYGFKKIDEKTDRRGNLVSIFMYAVK